MNLGDNKMLVRVAAALVKSPGATYQELAAVIGVSRATLYRFCSSRKELVHRLLKHSVTCLTASLHSARLDEGPAEAALLRLIEGQIAHRELHAFLTEYWRAEYESDPEIAAESQAYERTLDAFFLKGQKQGVFRIDVTAAALNETLMWMVIGFMDAERRGRVARASLLPTVQTLFFQGAATQ